MLAQNFRIWLLLVLILGQVAVNTINQVWGVNPCISSGIIFLFLGMATHQGQSLNIQHSDTTSRQKVHVMCRVRIKRGDVTCFLLFATQASLSSQTGNHALQLILIHTYAVQSQVLSNVMHFCIFTQATIVRGENLPQCSSILGIAIWRSAIWYKAIQLCLHERGHSCLNAVQCKV